MGIKSPPPPQILAGKLKPNLGDFKSPPDWESILLHFRGSELQNYFTKILEDDIRVGVWEQENTPRWGMILSYYTI